ncbi:MULTISPECIES: hypothetical protein [Bacillus]|uniref:Uncharacterized protein n=5 Tax=Bacillus cereus group TaxID=86661 RepID=A0A1W6WZE6_BACTU|nr:MULTISPECIES: hypothetical protein [Bacillus]EOP80613.1 hypothetical protein IES_06399 [Bacillus cereus BMG1.7]AEA19291.1 hypothetical protein CT43_P127109 [Bacillus thuringiensis serovar chinensis CT-43]AGE81624.1 hypothetical protein HD73_7068 [Bacillus thuringiensis serovar kurstaki str. HD73]AGG04815.1 hypothetical protein H175_107p091 [Bacillus thuringiensis serovar thuringiensis str. IS5056]AHZ55220.1 hypothetical protein YBT1520_33121 [Bacillus thuringiensis serovar kurstaki str. YBT
MQLGKVFLDDEKTEIMVELIHDMENGKKVLKGFVYELKDETADEFNYEERYADIPVFSNVMDYQPNQDKEIEDWAEELVQEYQLYLQRKEDEKQMIQEAFDVLSRTVKEPKKRLKRA